MTARKLMPLLDLQLVDLTQVREIHAHPCAHCPSANQPEPDEMTRDILTWTRAGQLERVFRCAWRGKKACKGYCDVLGVSEAELQEEP